MAVNVLRTIKRICIQINYLDFKKTVRLYVSENEQHLNASWHTEKIWKWRRRLPTNRKEY